MGDVRLMRVDPTLPCTAATVHPAWAVEEQTVGDATRHRGHTGALATAVWGHYLEFRVPLAWVALPEAALLESWWRADAAVAFTLDTSAARSTAVCAIANATAPLADRVPPAGTHRAGVLVLRSRHPGGWLGQPFVLDHPQWGRLDDPLLTLTP